MENANFLDIDDCLIHTCANGGLCVDGINTYTCNCSAGYTGERCLTGRYLCLANATGCSFREICFKAMINV